MARSFVALRWEDITIREAAVIRTIKLKPFLEGETIDASPAPDFKADPPSGVTFGTPVLADSSTEIQVPLTAKDADDYNIWCQFTRSGGEVREVGPIELKVVRGGKL